MKKDSTILIVGHNGIIEKSLAHRLRSEGYIKVDSASQLALNTTIQPSVYQYFQEHKPEYVFLASVKSGGIQANINNPAQFLYENLESQNNIVYASHKFGVKKLLYIASSCIYPVNSEQPFKEESILTGPLESTCEAYALAKIAGIKLCQAYRKQHGFNAVAMVPATLYGPNQDMDPDHSHVLGALMLKLMKAQLSSEKEFNVWGSGNPRREFLYIDDFLDACMLLMKKYNEDPFINVGIGQDTSIKELAEHIARAVDYKGELKFDLSKPDGIAQKLLDSSHIHKLGWKAQTSLEDGLKKTINWIKGV